MTNYEYIQSLTLEELAKLLCNNRNADECGRCIATEHCRFSRNGYVALLESDKLPDEWAVHKL